MQNILDSITNGQYKQAAIQAFKDDHKAAEVFEELYGNGFEMVQIKSFLFSYEARLLDHILENIIRN